MHAHSVRLFQSAPAAVGRPCSHEVQRGAFNGAGRGWPGSVHSANKRAQDFNRIGADRLGNSDKFNDVDASFATFIFGYKRLRPFEPLGELLLRQIGLGACFDHQLAEDLLLPGVDRFDNAARPSRHKRGRLIPLSDYPITGYSSKSELLLYRNRDCGLSAIIC